MLSHIASNLYNFAKAKVGSEINVVMDLLLLLLVIQGVSHSHSQGKKHKINALLCIMHHIAAAWKN